MEDSSLWVLGLDLLTRRMRNLRRDVAVDKVRSRGEYFVPSMHEKLSERSSRGPRVVACSGRLLG